MPPRASRTRANRILRATRGEKERPFREINTRRCRASELVKKYNRYFRTRVLFPPSERAASPYISLPRALLLPSSPPLSPRTTCTFVLSLARSPALPLSPFVSPPSAPSRSLCYPNEVYLSPPAPPARPSLLFLGKRKRERERERGLH